MDLKHEFTVEKPIDEAWKILTNVELIAPCLPGAQLEEVEGDTYRGMVKVKVGPIAAAFKGQASFIERDDANYRAVLKGEGRDTGGKGNASANITAAMTAVSPTSTKVDVTTDLTITGKVAQFGRGAMADISDKLLGQFVENLNNQKLPPRHLLHQLMAFARLKDPKLSHSTWLEQQVFQF
jgi:carbon monoxide dehydrogenase subunit G